MTFQKEKYGHQTALHAHRWLKRWQLDGTLEALQARILGIGQDKGLINWSYGAVDGSFYPWEGQC